MLVLSQEGQEAEACLRGKAEMEAESAPGRMCPGGSQIGLPFAPVRGAIPAYTLTNIIF